MRNLSTLVTRLIGARIFIRAHWPINADFHPRFNKLLRSLPYALCLLIACLLNACNIAKHLPANERLYMGTDVIIKADSTVPSAEQSTLKDQLTELARPRPNKQLFGYPYKVGFYYLLGEPRKNGLRAWFRKKFGEEPILASAKAISSNIPVWQAFMQNEGYFGSTASGSLKEDGYKARGVYEVEVKQRFHVDSVGYVVDSTPVRKALQFSTRRPVIKKGDPYRLDNIKVERERISQIIKQRGFYYFLPDYIGILADNDSVTHKTALYFYVKPDIPDAAGVPYSIRNVFIYPNYNLSTAQQDTNKRQAVQSEERFRIVDSTHMFNPKLFRDIVTVLPGQRYNSRMQDLTLSRFINVGAFKFVRNRFEPDQQGDSAVLDAHYYLTPYPEKSIRIEPDFTSRSNNFNGTQITVSWRNRNALRRAELLTLNANAGIEFQIGAGDQGVTNYRFGLDGILSFPRLVSPFRLQYDQRQALPKTNVTLGYQTIIRGGLYRINSFQTTFGYAWRQNQQVEHVFQPFSANYVYVPRSSIGDRVYDILLDSEVPKIIKDQYLNTINNSDQLILSSLYTFNYNSSPRSASPNTFRLTTNAEVAGNVASLFFRKPLVAINDPRNGVFGVPYAQYFRLDADARFYRKLTQNITWANRLFAGLGMPYGNYKGYQIPFTKQYFVGGSNSIRAFRPRAIGPGLFTRDTIRNLPIFQDGGGDIKLEANTELRVKFTKFLEGAVFVDAGNVWTYYNIENFTDGQEYFSPDFYKQIAIGTGIGLRIDLSYFLVRFDLATPLRKPYQTEGSEWVINQINFRSSDWRKQNLIFNIAIGYPF